MQEKLKVTGLISMDAKTTSRRMAGCDSERDGRAEKEMEFLMIKRIFKEFGRQRPNELGAALLAIPLGELVRGLVQLFTAGELRFVPRRRRARNLCTPFYRYHKANAHVADWFLNAARSLRDEQDREHYGIGALTERIRWDIKRGILKSEDGFRISNSVRACYVRLLLMRDPTFCGFFALKPSRVDASLVIDGRSWSDFADEHKAELWPERIGNKKPAASVRPLPEERHGSQ
jgi:hypothetical protein